MWSGADPPLAAGERVDAVDAEHVRLDPLDLGPERDEEAAEILDVRLAGGVADHRLAGRETAAMIAFSVAITLASSRKICSPRRPPSARMLVVLLAELDLGAHAWRTRGCAGRAGAGRSRRRPAAGRTTRPSRESSGPASRNDARIRPQSFGSSSCFEMSARVDAHLVRPGPRDLGAEVVEQIEHRLHVADPRHVRERHRLGREQRRGQNRQRAVLVPGRLHAFRAGDARPR